MKLSLLYFIQLVVSTSFAAPAMLNNTSSTASESTEPSPTSSYSAADSTPTVPYASDDPNFQNAGATSAQVGTLGANIIGPNNIPLDLQNPDELAPPTTDAGYVKNVKWPFALSNNRIQTGGWARQQNIDQLPIATALAGVDMRLTSGSIRELHWHTAAEWAYMIKGACQVSTVTPDGDVWLANVEQGDLWYFPPGYPHSIQALNTSVDGAEFLLVFDDGAFNEDNTFLLTDWLAHVPKEVIAKNFGTSISAFDHIPSEELYIFPSQPPPTNTSLDESVPNDTAEPFTYNLSKVNATPLAGGSIKIADASVFKVSKTIALAEITVEAGGMRELHWHPTEPEWTYYIEGTARMTVYASSGDAQTFDFQGGDVHYVPPSFGHYIENTGNTTLKFLEIFNSDKVQDISLQQWLALTPPELVKAHLDLSNYTIANLNKTKQIVVGPDPYLSNYTSN